jgi:hypothetical protein
MKKKQKKKHSRWEKIFKNVFTLIRLLSTRLPKPLHFLRSKKIFVLNFFFIFTVNFFVSWYFIFRFFERFNQTLKQMYSYQFFLFLIYSYSLPIRLLSVTSVKTPVWKQTFVVLLNANLGMKPALIIAHLNHCLKNWAVLFKQKNK